MKYQVTHRTEYRYEDAVSSSYGEMYLIPRNLPGQVCHRTEVTIDPEPDFYRERVDSFGNKVAYFELLSPHLSLAVTAKSLVSVEGRQASLPLLASQPWEQTRQGLLEVSDEDVLDARQFILESALVGTSAELKSYGLTSFSEHRPVLEAVTELTQRIHDEFAYLPGATSVTTTAEEVLVKGEGVCQDFAHLAIGCLRSLGLAARYVSGYLETDPPPGVARLEGADVSHAWASLFVPGAGWVDFDPTNRQLVNDRYLTTAWGRDYCDVPPLKGVIFTEGRTHDLEVVVDVVRLEGR
jgi:transglutaminase-like putative cysteine protease